MSDVFILQNQDNLLLGKNKEWLDGRDPGGLFKTLHKDEAINQMVESSSKDYTQRIKVLCCSVNEKGLPVIDAELLPPPLPKAIKAARRAAEADLMVEEDAEEELEFSAESETSENADSENADPQSPLL